MLICQGAVYREIMPPLNFCRQQHLSFFVWFGAELGGQLRSCSGDGSQGNHFGRVQGIHQVQRNRETTTHVQTHGQVKILELQTIETRSKTTVPKEFVKFTPYKTPFSRAGKCKNPTFGHRIISTSMYCPFPLVAPGSQKSMSKKNGRYLVL